MHRSRSSEAVASAVTAALRLRRRLVDLDRRHRDALVARFARPTAYLTAGVLAFALATLAPRPSDRPLRVAASARRPLVTTTSAAPSTTPAAAPAPLPDAAPVAPATVDPPSPSPVRSVERVRLPEGKGMWIWQPKQVEGGDVGAIVQRAVAADLTHLYVRTGSSVDGFTNAAFLDALLGPAHAAGITVYGWDFPYLVDPAADVARAMQAITYTTPDGQRLDGFSADIETPFEGVSLTADSAAAYTNGLRAAAGPDELLIATVPRPSDVVTPIYPYAEVIGPFDVVAPMVYWLNREPDTDAAEALDFLAQFGKPIAPIGQAYDGGPEGGRPGPPTPDEIERFCRAAAAHGAIGASFWSWQHADPSVWDAITASPEFQDPRLIELSGKLQRP